MIALLLAPLLLPPPRPAPRPAGPALARDDQPVALGWRGKSYTTRALPKELGEPARRPIEVWTDWARENDYRFDYDAEARVLLLSHGRGGTPTKKVELVARTIAWFDGILPLPPPQPAQAAKPDGAPPKADGAPASGPDGAPAGQPAGAPASEAAAPGFVADAQPAVMLVLRDERDRSSVLEQLAARHPYLADWVRSTGQQLGFVLEEPLCGAYVEKASGQKEWSPNPELVHRVAELLTLRRFGRVPFWIAQGLGWEAEIDLDDSVWCFPYRTEFVYAAEHGAWPVHLRNDFKDRVDKPVAIHEVASWPRGRFEARPARVAWGLVHVAATRARPGFSQALEELRQLRDVQDRRSTGPNTWERVPGYEVPPGEQERILLKHLGAEFLNDASDWFRKPGSPPEGAVKR